MPSSFVEERAALVLGAALAAFGSGQWGGEFSTQFAAGLAVFALGIPFALWVFRLERVAESRFEREARERELRALTRAGQIEAERILNASKEILEWLDGGQRPTVIGAPIQRVWLDMLAERYFQLTSVDDPLHDLRQAHTRLDDAAEYLKELDKLARTDPDRDRFKGQAHIAATAAKNWAKQATEELGRATLAW